MKRHLLFSSSSLLFVLSITTGISAQEEAVYDSTLAKRLGGNENGMKMFHLVLLTSGPKADLPKTVQDSLFKGHMDNIHRLADLGLLSLAGPFGKNDRYRGLFIFNTESAQDTEELLKTDPAIEGGALGYEIYPWYGSAAVNEIPHIHKKISKN